MKRSFWKNFGFALCLGSLLVFAVPTSASAAATVTVLNFDGAGEGFNDPTPATPVGGNPGTTVGQQRLNAVQFAADIWGATLDSNVEIRIQGRFDPLTCGVLAQAGTITVARNFSGAEFLNTWYHVALANRRAGEDLFPADNDIHATFNSDVGGTCTGSWYYGYDNNHGTSTDLVAVALHEFGHGLGFSTFTSVTTGVFLSGSPSIYDRYIHDNTLNLNWHEMTNLQRVGSAINFRNVVWDGALVSGAVLSALRRGEPNLAVNSPPSIAGNYHVTTAAFGPALSTSGLTGNVILANDGEGTPSDACEPLINGKEISGNIALVDRGTCTFIIKVANAQNAGATAVIVANNVAGSPIPMGGADLSITIPSIMISLADGNIIKAELAGGVNATLGLDLSRYAGTDATGRVRLYTPNPVAAGSTISHWDSNAFPNLLLEPSYSSDLPHSLDLTVRQMADIGWFPTGRVNRKISYRREAEGSTSIYLMNSDGTGQSSFLAGVAPGGWAPHGQRTAYVTSPGGSDTAISVANSDGSQPTALTTPGTDREPAWSSAGKIAFARDPDGSGTSPEIYTMDADGTNVTRLTFTTAQNSHPTWSPDGSKIAFWSNREDSIRQIWVMNADGSNPTRLTFSGANDSDPDWSPDGAKIAFASDRDGNNEIYKMDSDGNNPVRLTNNTASDLSPVWSPNGARIAFASDRDGNNEIYAMNADGTSQTNLTNTPTVSELIPRWQGLP